MDAFILLNNVNVNVFILNPLIRERERFKFLNEPFEHCNYILPRVELFSSPGFSLETQTNCLRPLPMCCDLRFMNAI